MMTESCRKLDKWIVNTILPDYLSHIQAYVKNILHSVQFCTTVPILLQSSRPLYSCHHVWSTKTVNWKEATFDAKKTRGSPYKEDYRLLRLYVQSGDRGAVISPQTEYPTATWLCSRSLWPFTTIRSEEVQQRPRNKGMSPHDTSSMEWNRRETPISPPFKHPEDLVLT